MHCAKLVHVIPQSLAGAPAAATSGHAGGVPPSMSEQIPVPSMRSSKRKSAPAHAPAARRHTRREHYPSVFLKKKRKNRSARAAFCGGLGGVCGGVFIIRLFNRLTWCELGANRRNPPQSC